MVIVCPFKFEEFLVMYLYLKTINSLVCMLKLSSSVGLQWIQISSHFGMSSGLLSNLNVGSFRSYLSEVQMQLTVFVKYCKRCVAWLFILYNIIAKWMPVKHMEANLNLFCRVSIFCTGRYSIRRKFLLPKKYLNQNICFKAQEVVVGSCNMSKVYHGTSTVSSFKECWYFFSLYDGSNNWYFQTEIYILCNWKLTINVY